jgi:hypothetical protein
MQHLRFLFSVSSSIFMAAQIPDAMDVSPFSLGCLSAKQGILCKHFEIDRENLGLKTLMFGLCGLHVVGLNYCVL